MSTVQKVNFEPVSSVLNVWLKDLGLADKTLAEPLNAVALCDGEWVTLDASYKWIRASTIGSVGNEATLSSFPVFFELGRTDRQGMSEKKTTAVFTGEWEFDTRIYDATTVVGSGAAMALMKPVKVGTITIGSRNYTGLLGHGGTSDNALIVGYVTRMPSTNGGKLRIKSGYRR